MAPRKRKNTSESDGAVKRVTRSQTRGDVTGKALEVKEKPKTKNVKEKPKTKNVTEKPKRTPKRGKDVDEAAEKVIGVYVDDVENDGGVHKGKTVVVEHCTQCTQFKKRAIMVKEGLVDAVPGVTVVLNPSKPRRGCFEVREEGKEPFISLLNMKRPFGPMKELDMEDVIASIVDKIKE